jgi:cardiolipin synthase
MKLLIQPADGVAPLLAAIKGAKKSIEIAIFRFDRTDLEKALIAAAARGVRVTALIAFANRGGERSLRRLELRCLAAGIIVARTANDLVRYHGKYILIDRRVLYVLSFNFTRLDIDHSRGFGLVTNRAEHLKEATRLFKADCTRTRYAAKAETFVVSPANSRQTLGAFLRHAKHQLLIYDPKIADKEMLRILLERAKAGVEIRVIGQVVGKPPFETKRLPGMRLHTRTIVRDRHQAFIGSQSLRTAELDTRREVGLIVQDRLVVKRLFDTFEADWARTSTKVVSDRPEVEETATAAAPTVSPAAVAKAVAVFTKELKPLAAAVKKAVKQAVVKAGDDVLQDRDVKETMKKIVKGAVKSAVKQAVRSAQGPEPSTETA